MGNDTFSDICLQVVADEEKINKKEVYVVWLTKVLQNNKALVSTTQSNGMYYEITYNGDKEEFYFDSYKKVSNRLITKMEVS